MSASEALTIELSARLYPVLEKIRGETPHQKIAALLLDEIRRNLEACEQERLEMEIKYGMEYHDFEQKVRAGELGDEFGYELETDAMRWSDLIAEKRYWLQQLNLLKELTR